MKRNPDESIIQQNNLQNGSLIQMDLWEHSQYKHVENQREQEKKQCPCDCSKWEKAIESFLFKSIVEEKIQRFTFLLQVWPFFLGNLILSILQLSLSFFFLYINNEKSCHRNDMCSGIQFWSLATFPNVQYSCELTVMIWTGHSSR